MFDHQDSLEGLNQNRSLTEQLSVIHNSLKKQFPFVGRIAVASYDNKTGILKTFIASDSGKANLVHYEDELEKSNSLLDIMKSGNPRVVNDISLFDNNKKLHSIAIRKSGFISSYTHPIYQNGIFQGFIFLNSDQKDSFNPDILSLLDVYMHLISSLVSHEITVINTLLAALKTANQLVHARDPETGNHSERMARYSRLIAQQLAKSEKYKFNDEYIEHIFLFAPIHDIGKIGIPDQILLKEGTLTDKEIDIMQSHTIKGRDLINNMVKNFGLDTFQYVDILRNIAECHHEVLDGTGYPNKMKGKEIPIEARIIAVADIFDALTSQRSYKLPWTNDAAFEFLKVLSKNKLDKDCVEALIISNEKVLKIQNNVPG